MQSRESSDRSVTVPAGVPVILFAAIFLLGSVVVATCAPPSVPEGNAPVIQPGAHSHNDEMQKRPLLDALAFGFCSIEADVHLVDGELLVAHDRNKVDARRTLDSLYLRPLWERYQANGGHIYAEEATVTLLVDIKDKGAETFRVLDRKLADYAPMLTHFTDEATTPGAVTVIISGDRANDVILASSPRLAAIDGRLSDLNGPLNPNQMPLISDNWLLHFSWLGVLKMGPRQAAKLDAIVAKAHAHGVRVRFWGTPQSDVVWGRLYDAGVDLLNTDNLDKLSALLLKKRGL